MAVITISRDLASGGRKLGRLLSKKLKYEFVQKSLFQKIAEDLDVSERTLESFEKSREYRISNIFSSVFSKNYIQRIVGHDRTVVEEQEYQNRRQGRLFFSKRHGKLLSYSNHRFNGLAKKICC